MFFRDSCDFVFYFTCFFISWFCYFFYLGVWILNLGSIRIVLISRIWYKRVVWLLRLGYRRRSIFLFVEIFIFGVLSRFTISLVIRRLFCWGGGFIVFLFIVSISFFLTVLIVSYVYELVGMVGLVMFFGDCSFSYRWTVIFWE